MMNNMEDPLVERWLPIPEQSCFLFGPRGTGKSILLQARYPEALRLDFLNPAVERTYKRGYKIRQQWHFEGEMEALNSSLRLV